MLIFIFFKIKDEMINVLAIGASNSKKSINKLFANYIANQIEEANITDLDWNSIILPLYSPDLEAETGIPANVLVFKKLIEKSDAIVLSLAEYNGLHTAAFKNLWDWTSRIDMAFWANKPIFLSATSPGARGGANVLRVTKELMPYFGGNVIADFSLPSYFENFRDGKIVVESLNKALNEKIALFQQEL